MLADLFLPDLEPTLNLTNPAQKPIRASLFSLRAPPKTNLTSPPHTPSRRLRAILPSPLHSMGVLNGGAVLIILAMGYPYARGSSDTRHNGNFVRNPPPYWSPENRQCTYRQWVKDLRW